MEAKFKYAVRKGGSNYGIEDIKQLKDLVAKGKVDGSDYVFIYKTEEWKRLGELGELRVFFPGFGAAASSRQPTSDHIRTLPNLRQLEAAKNNQSSTSQASYRPKNDASQSKLDVGSLFAGVLDAPESGKPQTAAPARPQGKSGSDNGIPRANAGVLPRPNSASTLTPVLTGSTTGPGSSSPFGSSTRLPRIESSETPLPPTPAARPSLDRTHLVRYILFVVLVALASGALTFYVMRHANEQTVASGNALPVRSSR